MCVIITHVGLSHCLSLYLTPPPQVLLHELYGPNSLHPPFTGVTMLLPLTHCPRIQICQTDSHNLACSIFAYACIHWWIHSLYHQQVEDFWSYMLLHLTMAYTTNVSIFPNRYTYVYAYIYIIIIICIQYTFSMIALTENVYMCIYIVGVNLLLLQNHMDKNKREHIS